MKKIFFSLIFSLLSVAFLSCGGNDEPEPVKTDEITRVQDGNGKVFLENGVLVNANVDYTSAELNKALTEYEWYFEYGFFYDNTHVSPKMDLGGYYPTNIHVDGTIEYANYPDSRGKIRDYTVKGKEMTVISHQEVHSSLYIPNSIFIILALDLGNEGGRMIIDKQLSTAPLEGYDANSSYVRMVWKTTPNN